MPNPTREDIIEAHKALTNLLKLASGTSTASAIFNEKIVRDTLPPLPRPTMDKIAWDDEKHYLAEVENRTWGRGVMLYLDDERDTILCQFQQEGAPYTLQCELDTLTPTGNRYTLTEVQE